MLSNLLIILPIFALILTGWVARRSNVLGPNATGEINRFVVYLALPAMLFDIMAKASLAQIWQPAFIAAFSAGSAAIFVFTLWFRMRRGTHLADAAIDALNTSYANVGFIGFPMILALMGESGMGATLVATILTVAVIFAAGIVLIEFGLQSGGSLGDIVRRTCLSLIKNPLIVAPALGAVFMVTGWTLPRPLDSYLKLLGGAASPCALVALGLFLAGNSGRRPQAGAGVENTLIFLKLIAQPLLVWVFAWIFGLERKAAAIAVLLTALPTGTGPFMLAEFYDREALLTGRVILKTTILSVATLAIFLSLAA